MKCLLLQSWRAEKIPMVARCFVEVSSERRVTLRQRSVFFSVTSLPICSTKTITKNSYSLLFFEYIDYLSETYR